jgi:hypothetical protein
MWAGSTGEMTLTGDNRGIRRKRCSSVTVLAISTTRNDLGLNPTLRIKKPAVNLSDHGTD